MVDDLQSDNGAGAMHLSWDVRKIQSDLGCSSCAADPDAFLRAGNQTGCAEDEIYFEVAQVGSCVHCDAQHLGPGFYCHHNQAVLCPGGYFCPNYTHKVICPEGHWCKSGFVHPMDCSPFVVCTEGSESQTAGAGLIFSLLWMVSLCFFLSFCIGIRKRRAEKAMRDAAALLEENEDFVLGEPFSADVPKVAISFEHLSMRLKSDGRCVLDDVTGEFPASSLVALMGPSGGGKTTFMNALCGRASYGNVTGTIKVNGQAGGVTDFPHLVGFVPQDDILHADLTVHQNLLYSARLRLPASASYDDAVLHVNQVVKTLGLEHVAHHIVGDPEKRGISGGQKKRVNIGMELAAMPAVIFMDEPTSGLDGAATVQLAKCLQRLRQSGLTIVCVIHQPRYAVFQEFSHLLLLGAGGGQVYCGATSGLEPYFTSLGFRLPYRENPADWMIDIVSGLENRYHKDSGEVDEAFTAPTDLYAFWKSHCEQQDKPVVAKLPKPLIDDRVTPNILAQTMIFFTREARRWSKTGFLTTCCGLIFCGLLFGVLMQTVAEFSYAGILQITTGNGFIFFMISTLSARSIFGYERLQYLREFSSGTSVVAYWFAKMLWSMIAWYFYSLCYTLPLYWTMPVPAQSFMHFFTGFRLAAWYHLGLGMVLTVVFPNQTVSLLLCVFVPMMLELAFSGSLITIADMSAIEKMMSAMSCGRWFKSALFAMEMRQYPEHTLDFKAVEEVFSNYETTIDEAAPLGFFSLLVMGIVFRLWTLGVLLLLKYSEGNSCVGRMVHLASKWLQQLGFDAIFRPKEGDAVDSVMFIERRPSVSNQVMDRRSSAKSVGGQDSKSSAAKVVVVVEPTASQELAVDL